MTRIKMLTQAEMNDDQRRVYESAVAGRRGHAPAPLIAWLGSPELADRAQKLGEFVRYQTTLPPRLSELAILVTARHWTAPVRMVCAQTGSPEGSARPRCHRRHRLPSATSPGESR